MTSNGRGEIVPIGGVERTPPPPPLSLAPAVRNGGGPSGTAVLEDDAPVSPLRRAHQLLRGRYHWAVLLALLFGAAGALPGALLLKPEYTSNGLLAVQSKLGYIVEVTEDAKAMQGLKDFVNTQSNRVSSQRNLMRALEDPELVKFGLAADIVTVNQLAEKLEVGTRGNRIDVAFTSEDPAQAEAIVRAIVTAYMDLFGTAEDKSRADRRKVLDELEIKFASERDALEERRRAIDQQGVVSETYNLKVTQLQKVESLRQAAQTILIQQGVNLRDMPAVKSVNEMTAEELQLRDSVLAGLLSGRKQIEAEMDVQRAMRFGPGHPVMRSLQAKLDAVNRDIAVRMEEVKAAGLINIILDPDQIDPIAMRVMSIDELRRLEDQLAARSDELRVEIDALSVKRLQISRVTEELDRVSRDLARVVDRRKALEIEEDNAPARIEVLEDATTPTKPSNGGKRKQLAALGALAGMSAGVSLVMLLGLINPKLRNIEDARTGLHQVRMLGILPSLPEDLADPMQASIAAHCVHQVRAMLQIGVAPDAHRVYSVTSPGAGTGKTSLTLALGLSFAASDSKTLLVDCDLVGGGLTRRIAAVVRRRIGHMLQKQGLVTAQQIEAALRYSQEKGVRLGQALVDLHFLTESELDTALNLQEQSLVGVMDACNGEPFDHCIAETGVKNLWVLPTGTAMARHAASLSPTAVRRLVDQARSRFDTVLIDTGPVLGSLEASIVAGTVDGVVLIVARGEQRAAADKSVEYLHSIRSNLLGIVFNRAEHQDIERSSYTSLTSISSLRPDEGAVLEGEVIDGEASARLGPVGSAVATNSRITRNGRGRKGE